MSQKTKVKDEIKVSLRTFVAESTKGKLEKATAIYGVSLGEMVDFLVNKYINKIGLRR
mgnify:CR=1 FL=1